ncbi:MAG: hypothetical protein IPH35_07460 [Rhodoferax sp.]|nr:hypothetical protein [Rhodoferax sp.]
MKTNKLTIILHIILLLALTACGGGSSTPPENDFVMLKLLRYNDTVEAQFGDQKSENEALSNERGILAQRGIFVKIEMCGDRKEPHIGFTFGHFITVSETQASLVKSIGYEKYTEDGKWTLRTCR